MKFTAQREHILAIVEHAEGVVERRNTIPILGNIMLEVDDGYLRVTATDLDLTIEEKITDVEIGEPGKTTVNSTTFTAMLRKMPSSSQISIEVKDGWMSVRSGRINYRIPVIGAEDFPIAPKIDAPQVTIAIEDIERAFKKVKNSISTEETRHYLNGAYMTIEDGALFAVSTDGHRLSIAKVAEMDMAAPDAIIPRKAVGEMIKLLPLYEGDALFRIDDRKVEVSVDDLVITSKLIDGTFPDYRRVIPTGNDITMVVDADILEQAIDRVSVVTQEKTSAVKMEIGKDSVRIIATSPEMGNAEESVACECSEELTVGYNSRYLKEILSGYSGKEIELKLNNESSPILIFDPKDPQDRNVLMPMRI